MLHLTDSGDWEDNWLFQRSSKILGKKFIHGSCPLLYPDEKPVCMLVPNPTKESDSRPSIGDVDIDLISELSERISVGSLDYSWTSDESQSSDDTASSAMYDM